MMKCGTYKVSSDTCGFFFLLVTNIVCGLLLCDTKHNFLICAWRETGVCDIWLFFLPLCATSLV